MSYLSTSFMQRRHVLAGFVAGMSLLAGCNGNGGGGGNNTTQSTNGGGTPLTSGGSETSTSVATTIAETAQQTATQTATPAPTPSATPMPSTSSETAGPTEIGTAGVGTFSGMMDVDLSNPQTYTNDAYFYTIEYPSAWEVSDTRPSTVSITSSSSIASLLILVQENMSSTSLDQATSNVLRGYSQSTNQEGSQSEVLNRQNVTLPNDNPARLLETRISNQSSPTTGSVRQKLLITLANNALYAVAFTLPESTYTSTIDQQSDDMLTSLTISDGSIGTESG